MSAELVPINNDFDHALAKVGDRSAALERLNISAQTANEPQDANMIRIQAAAISDALKRMAAHESEVWLAKKAHVLAARRVGQLLLDVDGGRPGRPTEGGGKSLRTLMIEALGISNGLGYIFIRLGRIPDPEFQRYIQNRSIVPTVNGALGACLGTNYGSSPTSFRHNGTWATRRKAAGVKTPSNPSIDESHSLVVRALGHLSAHTQGYGRKAEDLKRAMYLVTIPSEGVDSRPHGKQASGSTAYSRDLD